MLETEIEVRVYFMGTSNTHKTSVVDWHYEKLVIQIINVQVQSVEIETW